MAQSFLATGGLQPAHLGYLSPRRLHVLQRIGPVLR